MDNEQAKQQEAERRAQEARRRAHEVSRKAENAGRAMGEMASVGAETAAVWADASERAMRELLELSAGTAKETAKLYNEMQQSMIDAIRDMQSMAFRWNAMWPEMFRDPFRWYQRTMMDSVDYAQRNFKLIGGTAEALTESVERLQHTAEEAGKGIQETFTSATSRMREVYAQADRAAERSAA
jgi:methyl-accepting chemotaxis protein